MATCSTQQTTEKSNERTGQTKGRWQHIGKVFRHDDGGTSIKLDAIPLLKDWDGWVSVFKIDEQQNEQPPAQPAPQPAPSAPPAQMEDDDVPF